MNKMKRILAIGLTLIMLGSFAACGKDKDKDKDPDAEKTSVSTTQTVKLAYNGRLGAMEPPEGYRFADDFYSDDQLIYVRNRTEDDKGPFEKRIIINFSEYDTAEEIYSYNIAALDKEGSKYTVGEKTIGGTKYKTITQDNLYTRYTGNKDGVCVGILVDDGIALDDPILEDIISSIKVDLTLTTTAAAN